MKSSDTARELRRSNSSGWRAPCALRGRAAAVPSPEPAALMAQL